MISYILIWPVILSFWVVEAAFIVSAVSCVAGGLLSIFRCWEWRSSARALYLRGCPCSCFFGCLDSFADPFRGFNRRGDTEKVTVDLPPRAYENLLIRGTVGDVDIPEAVSSAG